MRCVEAQRLIKPYLENQLSDEELHEFLAHIEGCKGCREDLEIYLAVYGALETSDEEDIDYNFVRALKEKLAASRKMLEQHRTMTLLCRTLVLTANLMLVFVLYTAVSGKVWQQRAAEKFSYLGHVEQESEQETEDRTEEVEEFIELQTGDVFIPQ